MLFTIGVTGGIACGKTTFLRRIEKRGYECIYLDEITGHILKKGSLAYNAVVSRWGAKVLNEVGEIDRPTLRNIVIFDKTKKRALEAITHPLIYEKLDNLLKERAKTGTKDNIAFVEAPLLFEAKWEALFDLIVCIVSGRRIQQERLIKRNKIPLTVAERWAGSQLPNEEKARRSDIVIENNGQLMEFLGNADNCLDRILTMTKETAKERVKLH